VTDTQEFMDRYLAVWHESDATRRSHAVEQIWTSDAEHYTATIEARGFEQITARVAGAYEKWVAPGQYRFRAGSAVDSHHD
jgi:hypothetical protein